MTDEALHNQFGRPVNAEEAALFDKLLADSDGARCSVILNACANLAAQTIIVAGKNMVPARPQSWAEGRARAFGEQVREAVEINFDFMETRQ